MNYIRRTLILFVGMLASCTYKGTESVPTIDIDSLAKEKPCFELKVNRYIPLETNDDVLIGFIRKIEYRNNMFFVCDYDSNSIFIFDNEGRYLSSISKRGRGPGEYISINDFTIDDDLNIYVLCAMTSQIIKYSSPDYTHENSIKLNTTVTEICWSEGLIWVANVFKDDMAMGLGYLKNTGMEIVIPGRKKIDGLSEDFSTKPQSFYPGQSLLFNQRMSPDVYRISGESVEEIFKIRSRDFVASSDSKDRDKKIYGFHSLFQSGDFIIGMLWKDDYHDSNIIIHEISSGKNSFSGTRQLPGFSGICAVAGPCFLTYTDAGYIIENHTNDETMKELLNKIDAESNPVLIEFSVVDRINN